MQPVGPSQDIDSHFPPTQSAPVVLSRHWISPLVLHSAPGFGGLLHASARTVRDTTASVRPTRMLILPSLACAPEGGGPPNGGESSATSGGALRYIPQSAFSVLDSVIDPSLPSITTFVHLSPSSAYQVLLRPLSAAGLPTFATKAPTFLSIG